MKIYLCDRCGVVIPGDAGSRTVRAEAYRFGVSAPEKLREGEEDFSRGDYRYSEANLCLTCLSQLVSMWCVAEEQAYRDSAEFEKQKQIAIAIESTP